MRAKDELCTKFEEFAKKVEAITFNKVEQLKVEQPKVEQPRKPLLEEWCANCDMVGHQPQVCSNIPIYQEALLMG